MKIYEQIYPTMLFIFFMVCCSFNGFPQGNTENRVRQNFQSALTTFAAFEENHRRFLAVENGQLSYLEWGSQENNAKVFIWLHGSLSNAYEIRPFAEAIVKLGYRVISIDQYHAGLTPLPPFDASFDDLCVDIRTLMDHLTIEKAVFAGFSRGAYLATNFYGLYPDRVRGIVLEDGGSVAFDRPYLKLDKQALAAKLQRINMPQEVYERYHGFKATKFDAYQSLYDVNNASNQFEILSFIRPIGEKWVTYRGQPEYYHMQDSLHMAEILFEPTKASNYARSIVKLDPEAIFKDLHIPLLILDAKSDNDPTPVEEENKALAEQHPDFIRHLVFDGVDHNIHFARPTAFLMTVLDFLENLETGTTP